MKSLFRQCLVLLACVMTSAASSAQGNDDATEAGRLLRSGLTDQAAAKVESGLANKPRDPQLRFLRGVIQIEQKKNSEAIATFQRMVEDFPELPEPYNNLAVLYAGQGQYDKSRAALELAIRTHPSYATAHENLGDVYTKMASESYSKALQLDSGNNAAQMKLNVIKDLSTAKPGKPSPMPAAATVPVPAPVVAPIVASAPAAPKPAPAAVQAPPPPSKPTTQKADESDAVYTAVVAWAKAWSSQNVDAYLASYGKSFVTPNGEDRKTWEKERRARIEGKRSITVALDSPTVEMTGDHKATVRFRQVYKADSLSTNSRKTLKLGKADNGWKIIEESTGK
jgi:tetratricopeptide (TPR) repeat protein